MLKFDYRSRVSFAVCLTLPASFPRCALASQLIDSKFDQHNTFKSVVRAVFAINPTSDLQPQIRATLEPSPALLCLYLLFLRPVRTPRLNSNYNRVSPVPKAPIDLCQAPLAKLRAANCLLSLPPNHTQPYQLSLSSHTAFQTAIQTCQAAFALILQRQNETRKNGNGNTKQKKSERNFHNEHVHNHLALSPWSIWLHATRRRVSRIIPIVLRPKRGCKIFIISCPLPGRMQCKAISRFSIFHFIFFYSFPSFWQIF